MKGTRIATPFYEALPGTKQLAELAKLYREKLDKEGLNPQLHLIPSMCWRENDSYIEACGYRVEALAAISLKDCEVAGRPVLLASVDDLASIEPQAIALVPLPRRLSRVLEARAVAALRGLTAIVFYSDEPVRPPALGLAMPSAPITVSISSSAAKSVASCSLARIAVAAELYECSTPLLRAGKPEASRLLAPL